MTDFNESRPIVRGICLQKESYVYDLNSILLLKLNPLITQRMSESFYTIILVT